jgi:hypothetical protein
VAEACMSAGRYYIDWGRLGRLGSNLYGLLPK